MPLANLPSDFSLHARQNQNLEPSDDWNVARRHGTTRMKVLEEIKKRLPAHSRQKLKLCSRDRMHAINHQKAAQFVPYRSCISVRYRNKVAIRASDKRSVLAVLDPVHEGAAHVPEVLLETLDIRIPD
jgi:hypothetical protein